jgi:hypothetical protein
MKYLLSLSTLLLLILISGCQSAEPACPPESISYLADLGSVELAPSHGNPNIEPQLVEIKGKEIQVDKVIGGALCNDTWQGTVYVPCQIQILAWEENPTFLEGCELIIAPDTVVYVAAHNDEPYYQGCSCHTGEE